MIKQLIKAMVPSKLWENLKLLRFFYYQRIVGFDVPDKPHFDPLSSSFFEDLLLKSNYYIEFGSGGSTVLAVKLRKNFVTIDSDPYFLRAVKKKINQLEKGQRLEYVDIGTTGPWGVPLCLYPPDKRKEIWRRYPQRPWDEVCPDLVLVDGRFRVACSLELIKHHPNGEWTLLLDDYTERPEYWIVEKFAKLERMVGRMAVFTAKSHDRSQLLVALEHYYGDWN